MQVKQSCRSSPYKITSILYHMAPTDRQADSSIPPKPFILPGGELIKSTS